MTDIDENLAPEPTPDVDPKSLDVEPTPEEFFILSRVDGTMTVGQIGKTSGLGSKKTLKCIENLWQYGLIQLPGQPPPASGVDSTGSAGDSTASSQDTDTSSTSTSSSTRDRSKTKDSSKKSRPIRDRFPTSWDEFDFDEELLDQQVELEDDFKQEVLFVYDQLDYVNHYELLGVNPDAGRRQLRSSYFRMSKRFHPDRFYKKILGDYERRIEKIFQRVTKAYQTLSNRNKRQEYDDALEGGRKSHETPVHASTPASLKSEPREEAKSDRKREMAFKVLVRRGDKAIEEGLVSTALKEYRKALALHRNADLAHRVARTLLEGGDHLEDAASFARAAHSIDDSSVSILKLLGEIYERKGEPDDAVYHYEQALNLGSDDPELQQRIARLQK